MWGLVELVPPIYPVHLVWLAQESFFDEKLGLSGGAVGSDAVFDGDDAVHILAQRGVNDPLLRSHVAVDDGQIFFLNTPGFPDLAEFAGGGGILGDDHEAGGFAVQTVDEVRGCWLLVAGCWFLDGIHLTTGIRIQVEAGAADEAGVFVAFGGMADEVGRLVNDEQVGVLVDDGEQFFQTGQKFQTPPNRRWRLAYSSSAAKNCGLRKSGQRVGVMTSSA